MSAHRLRILFIASLMALTGLATAALKPVQSAPQAAPDLEALLPEDFAGWRRIAISDAVLPAETELKAGEAVAYRAYRDELGRTVTLVVAYGPPLGDSVRLHRPEKCYVAQGFEILARSRGAIEAGSGEVTIVNLDAKSPSRREAVSYWLRDGESFSARAAESALLRFRAGLTRPLDGALVRASTINAEAPQFDLNEAFLADFADALSPEARALLLGGEGGA